MKTVHELRKEGFEVKVRHNRPIKSVSSQLTGDPDKMIYLNRPEEKGGHTEVEIRDELGRLVGSGYAACCALDNYNRKLGVKIALGRALKGANL